jgi:hypothetical protein
MAFPFAALIPVIGEVLDRVIPDKAAAEKAKIEIESRLATAQSERDKDQSETNKIEAQHSSIFVAGWRPFIGWTCGVVLALYYIPMAVISTGLWVWACWQAGALVARPEMDIAEVIGLVMSLLGLGGLRTLEKFRGVAKR